MTNLRITRETPQNIWMSWLNARAPHTFLQSWQWKTAQEALGSTVYTLGIWRDDELVGTALTIVMKAKRGSILLCPHGPILDPEYKDEAMNLLATTWRELGRTHNCVATRVCSLDADTPEMHAWYAQHGFRDAPTHQHPELSWMIDVREDEETLLKNMRKSMRQSIRKAQEAQLDIRWLSLEEGLDIFWNLYQTTAARQHFTTFSRSYLEAECRAFADSHELLIPIGYYEGVPISGAIIVCAHNQAFYHHGASDQSIAPNVPAAHLVQWEIIREAKRRGYTYYNFWGVVPEDAKSHPWYGLSTFKRGLGGFEERYLHAQDAVYSLRYWLLWVVEAIRRKRRRL